MKKCTTLIKGDRVRVIDNLTSEYGKHSFKTGDEFTIGDVYVSSSHSQIGYSGKVDGCRVRQTLIADELELVIPKVFGIANISKKGVGSNKLVCGDRYEVIKESSNMSTYIDSCGVSQGQWYSERVDIECETPAPAPKKYTVDEDVGRASSQHLRKSELYTIEETTSGFVRVTDSCGKSQGEWYRSRFTEQCVTKPAITAPVAPPACSTEQYIIWSPDSSEAPKRVYSSYAQGRAAARSMSEKHTDQTFYVMKAYAKYVTKTSTYTTKEELS